jgi:glycosyltransferase involved in cell wall biosynthesis
MTKLRVAFINTHPIQYFTPLYAYLNRCHDFAITGLYLSDFSVRGTRDRAFGRRVKWDIDLLDGYDARFVPGAFARNEFSGFFSSFAPGLWQMIRGGGFDSLVVHGHTPAAMVVGIMAAKTAGIPVFMHCETHLRLKRPRIKEALRSPILRVFYSKLDGFLAIGSANTEFYRAMGVPDHRIFLMPYAVDNLRFSNESKLTSEGRSTARAALGVSDNRPIVLFAAKFQQRKCPADLLKAAAILNQRGLQFHLAMVGSGTLEDDLCRRAAELGIHNICFPGFINQSLLPRVYAACDIFVLPSNDEPWGLAVNEAMCAGLPIVACSEIGCVRDLVQDGVNGRLFTAGDVSGLSEVLFQLIVGDNLRNRMGLASRNIIAGWSYAECATGLRAALASVEPSVKTSAEHLDLTVHL